MGKRHGSSSSNRHLLQGGEMHAALLVGEIASAEAASPLKHILLGAPPCPGTKFFARLQLLWAHHLRHPTRL